MTKIKFSHIYTKMPKSIKDLLEGQFYTAPNKTRLLEVLKGDSRELSQDFINYDTEYSEPDYAGIQTTIDGSSTTPRRIKHYPLPKGPVLILILLTETGASVPQPWTTIRRATPEKERYYKGLRGQDIDITGDLKA